MFYKTPEIQASNFATANTLKVIPKVALVENDLLQFIADRLGVKRQALDITTDWCDDLRVPPGQIAFLLEDIEEEYQIDLAGHKIRRVEDIIRINNAR